MIKNICRWILREEIKLLQDYNDALSVRFQERLIEIAPFLRINAIFCELPEDIRKKIKVPQTFVKK